MKRKPLYILSIILALSISSCVSKKKYVELESMQQKSQEDLDETRELLIDVLEEKDSLYNEIKWVQERVRILEDEKEYTESSLDPAVLDNAAFSFFYSLKSSKEILRSSFLNRGISLLGVNDQIIGEIHKMGYEEGGYKYFYTGNGYGIVTSPIPVTKDGGKGEFKPNCNWFNFLFCDGNSYYRMYVFLVVDNQPPQNRIVTMEEIDNFYDANFNLDYNWYSIPSIYNLLNDEKNLFDERFTFTIRVYDFLSEDFGNGSKVLATTIFEPFKECTYEPFKK